MFFDTVTIPLLLKPQTFTIQELKLHKYEVGKLVSIDVTYQNFEVENICKVTNTFLLA